MVDTLIAISVRYVSLRFFVRSVSRFCDNGCLRIDIYDVKNKHIRVASLYEGVWGRFCLVSSSMGGLSTQLYISG